MQSLRETDFVNGWLQAAHTGLPKKLKSFGVSEKKLKKTKKTVKKLRECEKTLKKHAKNAQN